MAWKMVVVLPEDMVFDIECTDGIRPAPRKLERSVPNSLRAGTASSSLDSPRVEAL
jgi:hypothetical protein